MHFSRHEACFALQWRSLYFLLTKSRSYILCIRCVRIHQLRICGRPWIVYLDAHPIPGTTMVGILPLDIGWSYTSECAAYQFHKPLGRFIWTHYQGHHLDIPFAWAQGALKVVSVWLATIKHVRIPIYVVSKNVCKMSQHPIFGVGRNENWRAWKVERWRMGDVFENEFFLTGVESLEKSSERERMENEKISGRRILWKRYKVIIRGQPLQNGPTNCINK